MLIFLPHYIVAQVFLIKYIVVSGNNSAVSLFRFRHSFNILICKNICRSILHSRPSPLLFLPHNFPCFPSPITRHLSPFLSTSLSTAAPCAQKTISNSSNTRSTYSIIFPLKKSTPFPIPRCS